MSSTPTAEYLRLADSRALDVLLWLYDQRDSENYVNVTLDQVARECNVTKVTVNRVFQRLYSSGFMHKIRNGQYQLHIL